MHLGKWLRQLRKQRNLRIRALAKAVKVDHAYLSRIESGRTQPSEETVHKLAKVLRYDEAELMILADRIPLRWRSAIKKAPQETASLIRESFEGYGNGTTEDKTTLFPLSNGKQPGQTSFLAKTSKRKSPAGVSTNELVFSAHLGRNDELFPKIPPQVLQPVFQLGIGGLALLGWRIVLNRLLAAALQGMGFQAVSEGLGDADHALKGIGLGIL